MLEDELVKLTEAFESTGDKLEGLLAEMEGTSTTPCLGDRLIEALKELNEQAERDNQKLLVLLRELGSCDEEGNIKPEFLPSQKGRRQKPVDDGATVSYEEVLRTARFEGNKLFIASGKLARSTYEQVDRVLRCCGGRWVGGKTQAHLFETNAEPLIAKFLETGELPELNPLAFFASKPIVAQKIADWIRPENSRLILDADAGEGALAAAVRQRFPDSTLHLVEIDPDRASTLRKKNLGEVFEEDFLQFSGSGYGAIVINPPFSLEEDRKAYITHIFKAWELLPGGAQLGAIAPLGFTFSKDKRSQQLYDLVGQYGSYEELPPKSFDGTNIVAALLFLTKPSSASETDDTDEIPSFGSLFGD
jgi:hypothetical protein